MIETTVDTGQKKVSNVNQFEALFNFATIGMIVTNAEGEIIDFNRCAENQFGYSKHEVLGKTVEVLIPSKFYKDHVKNREDYYTRPEVRVMGHGTDVVASRKNGTVFPVEVSLSHYTVSNQTFVIGFVIDVTVRKEQEEELLKQKQELERVALEIKSTNRELEQIVNDRTKMLREVLAELEKSKDELSGAFLNENELRELKARFVTMASHEFRTPLSTILSSAYLLEKYNQENPDQRIEKHIRRIKGAVGGMKGILEDFLSIGKLDDGLVQIKMEEVTATEIFEDVNNLLAEVDSLLKTGQLINLYNTINKEVRVDRNLIKNILTNLISNAINFSKENSLITIHLSIENDNFKISVKDHGIGIAEEDQKHLFERFFRAKNATNIEGTGLGLHIVHKYVELMNGRIEMTSKLNEGSTFTIYIPQYFNNEKL